MEAELDATVGRKYYLIVSNNRRNKALGDALAVRLTTSTKPTIDSIVELGRGEPFVGRVLCDDVVLVYADEVTRDLGALTPGTMRRVESGLKAALGIR